MNFDFNEYLQILGEHLGMELDGAEGECHLMVGESCPVNIVANTARETIDLSSMVAAELDEDLGYDVLLDLLNAGLGPLLDRPGVGRDPESGAIMLYAIVSPLTVTPTEFTELFDRFVALQMVLERKLS